MLTHLHIQGLALVDQVTLTFGPGLNIITGETGSGKSILIKAIGLLFGERGQGEHVRRGCAKASVVGHFCISASHAAHEFASSLDITCDANQDSQEVELIIRRSLSANGRSHAWLNDIPVTLGTLREIGLRLADIVTQHQSQHLVNETAQSRYLDSLLPNRSLIKSVAAAFDQSRETYNRIQTELHTFRQKQAMHDYLTFRYKEIEALHPSAEDFDALQEKVRAGHELSKSKDLIQSALNLIDGDNAADSVAFRLQKLKHCLHDLPALGDQEAILDLSSRCLEQINELSYLLARHSQTWDFDESDLESCRERLSTYRELFRKLNLAGVQELVAEEQRLAEEIEFVDDIGSRIDNLLEQFESDIDRLMKHSKSLTAARRKAARKFEREVVSELHDLDLKNVALRSDFRPAHSILDSIDLSSMESDLKQRWEARLQNAHNILAASSGRGSERPIFLWRPNVGETEQPLSKAASGGELARIMIALKRVAVDRQETATLVFDEVDTGVSGKTADRIGGKLKELSQSRQIVCISHLAQVASYADQHFRISKTENRKRTATEVEKLSKEDRLQEVARLLSGAKITAPSLANAETLLQRH